MLRRCYPLWCARRLPGWCLGRVDVRVPEADGRSILLGSMQGDVWRLPIGAATAAAGRPVVAGEAGAVLVAKNHGALAAKFAEGVGRGAGSSISGIGGSGVSEDIIKGVGVQVAGVCSVSYPRTVSDRFATAGLDNTVCGVPPPCTCDGCLGRQSLGCSVVARCAFGTRRTTRRRLTSRSKARGTRAASCTPWMCCCQGGRTARFGASPLFAVRCRRSASAH